MAYGDPLVAFVQLDQVMPRLKRPNPGPLETRIGYRFRNPELLKHALTHSSAKTKRSVKSDNQRLEFLGDRVLGLVVSELLLERFPNAPEGELSRSLNFLVRTERCAEVAADVQLGLDLIMDAGEANAGGRRKESILAGACEALLGAIFLDGGYAEVRRVARALWEPHLNATPATPPRDAKTALQEWAQGRKLSIPRYVAVKADGPSHAPRFTIEAHVDGYAPASAEGASKRAAEQAAAEAMLRREGVWEIDERRPEEKG
jgi:ribonuclease-3